MLETDFLNRFLEFAFHFQEGERRCRRDQDRGNEDVDIDAGVLCCLGESEVEVVVDGMLSFERAGLGARGAEGGEEDRRWGGKRFENAGPCTAVCDDVWLDVGRCGWESAPSNSMCGGDGGSGE